MNFKRYAHAILFHSSTQLTAEYEVARLERAKEEARWHHYDEPAWIRKMRAPNDEQQRKRA